MKTRVTKEEVYHEQTYFKKTYFKKTDSVGKVQKSAAGLYGTGKDYG